MAVLLTILLQFCAKTIDYAKLVGGMIKVEFFRMALRAKAAVVYLARYTAARVAFWAAIVLLFETCVTALAAYVARPVSSFLLRQLLPETGWAQALYYMVWDSGVSLSTAWSAVLVYWSNVFLVRRAINTLASALTYRIMIYNGQNQMNLGLLSGR